CFFFSSRRRHTISKRDWSSDVCSSDLEFSKENNEPAWMTELRTEAIDLANNLELPTPDKTKIHRWNFTDFKHKSAAGEAITSLRSEERRVGKECRVKTGSSN